MTEERAVARRVLMLPHSCRSTGVVSLPLAGAWAATMTQTAAVVSRRAPR